MRFIGILLLVIFGLIQPHILAQDPLQIRLEDGIIITIENPAPAVLESIASFEQSELQPSTFTIECEQNSPRIIKSGRAAAASYEQFRDQWFTDASETMLRAQRDPIFRDYIAKRLNDSFEHLLQTNSANIYDRILARLSLSQAVMQEEPYHTNLAKAVYQLQHQFFNNKGRLRSIDQEFGITSVIDQCASYCSINKKFSADQPNQKESKPLKRVKTFCTVWGDLTKRIAANATNKAIIACLHACKKYNFIEAQQIAQRSPHPLLLQRIIEQYCQEVNAQLYDVDGIYRFAQDDPVFKQLNAVVRKQLTKNPQQRDLLNSQLRARATMKNSLMEQWHLDQDAPTAVHQAIYQLIDDSSTSYMPYAITKIATLAQSSELINTFYLPNGILKRFENYSSAQLIPASAHLLKPEAALLRVLLNQAVYAHHEDQSAAANALLETMSSLIADMNRYGPLFGTQLPEMEGESLVYDVETFSDCIDNIRKLGCPHLAQSLTTAYHYGQGCADGTKERIVDIGSYLYEHPIKSTALAGGAAVCCYLLSLCPPTAALKLIDLHESLASILKPSTAPDAYHRGKEHASFAFDLATQCVVSKAGSSVLKKCGRLCKRAPEIAHKFFEKIEQALERGGLEPIDVTYEQILLEASDVIQPAKLPTVEPLPEVHIVSEIRIPFESTIDMPQKTIIIPASQLSIDIQTLPKTRELIKKYIKYDHKNEQLEQFLASKIHEYATEYNRPKCDMHQKSTRNGKHLEIPLPIRSAAEQTKIINTVRAYNFTALTPKEFGPQKGTWFDYDHLFGPSALINCKKNSRECVGFHHDYQGKIQNGGLVEFYITKKGDHGIYEADWAYYKAALKSSTFFPDEWSFTKILEKIIEASKNIKSYEFDSKKKNWAAKGITSEGISIKIIFEADQVTNYPTGKISTAYPVIED